MISTIANFRFKESWDIFESYSSLNPDREVCSFRESEDLIAYVTERSSCLVLCSIKEKDDLLALASFLKGIRSEKGVLFKVLAANFTGSKEVDALIARLDVPDVLSAKMPAKAFRLKMDMWLKALDVQAKQKGSERSSLYETPVTIERATIGSSISFGGANASCVLDDIQEKAVYVKVEEEIPIGHKVDLKVTLEHKKRKVPVVAAGEVAAVVPDEGGGFYVEVLIHEKDLPQVNSFVTALQVRQEEITNFLKAATGKA